MFTLQAETPLPVSPPAGFKGIAYDGASYFLTKEYECKIYQYGRYCNLEHCFTTCRNYAAICFDPKEHCFWASSNQYPATVFKLNPRFQEIDRIHIVIPDYNEELGCVTGLSYDCCCDRLVAAFTSCLVRVDKSRSKQSALFVEAGSGCILGVLSICPYIICRSMNGDKQVIQVFSSEGQLLKKCRISNSNIIESAVYIPSPGSPECLHLTMLVSRHHCYCYMWNCTLPCKAFGPPISPSNDWQCEPHRPRSGSFGSKAGHAEVLNSIAQLEKAISGILTAEGDKLQKVLATSSDSSQILEANQSVQATLTQTTHLEHMLYDLLETFQKNSDDENGSA